MAPIENFYSVEKINYYAEIECHNINQYSIKIHHFYNKISCYNSHNQIKSQSQAKTFSSISISKDS